jgi:hypothetical protein
MPVPVYDRPSSSHEYVFLLAKSQKYYYDFYSILEPVAESSLKRARHKPSAYAEETPNIKGLRPANGLETHSDGKNKPDVWWVSSQPSKEDHYASFSEKWIEPMVLAGTSEKGCCSECGAQWTRVIEKIAVGKVRNRTLKEYRRESHGLGPVDGLFHEGVTRRTKGWKPGCDCKATIEPAIILDPFVGTGTTPLVALKAGRRFIGIDISEKYCKIAESRIGQELAQKRLF